MKAMPRIAARWLFLLSTLLWSAGVGAAPKAPAPAPPPPAGPMQAVWCGPVTAAAPEDLAAALTAQKIKPLSGGALAAAGQAARAAQRAIAEFRCSDALSLLGPAQDRVRAEVDVADGRAALAALLALELVCADRGGDAARAGRAAEGLLQTGVTQPPDIALVMQRYRPGPTLGPTPMPTRVDTDPPGARLLRDGVLVGAAPADVPGGDPAVDALDVELPGYRKVHRPLGSGEKVALGLRSEDRLGVLVDAVAARPLGSDGQAQALQQLGKVVSGRVLVLSPRQQGGAPAAGERLQARVYDVGQRRWVGPMADLAAGTAEQQAQGALRLLQGQGAAPVLAPAAVAQAAQKAEPKSGGFLGLNFSFSRKRWYNWVIAGGVAALIAGLLIADQFKSNGVTIHATKDALLTPTLLPATP